MLIHLPVALEELRIVPASDGEHQRKTNCARERITSADPVPEREHVRGRDAELGDLLGGGRERDEVLGDVGLLSERLLEPRLCGVGVGHRLLRGERLRGDDEERLLGLNRLERLGEVRRVDVGHEEELERALRIRRERDIRHHGTEVGAADADVDNVLDALAGKALPFALPHLIGEIAHLREHFAHSRHDVLAIDFDLHILVLASERRVQHRAALGRIDLLTGEHFLDLGLEIGLLGQLDQRLQHRRVDSILGIVEEPAGGFK